MLVDASLDMKGSVHVTWRQTGKSVEIVVEDNGTGLANTTNLFVPFFTTKPNGSGIGLVLNSPDRRSAWRHTHSREQETTMGCEARLQLRL